LVALLVAPTTFTTLQRQQTTHTGKRIECLVAAFPDTHRNSQYVIAKLFSTALFNGVSD
jgi:hypothetical protein